VRLDPITLMKNQQKQRHLCPMKAKKNSHKRNQI
jgi:hypothetical protein